MSSTNTRARGAKTSMLDPAILAPAIWQSVRKLDPRAMARNPVMFVVEVVAALVTILFIRDLATGGANLGFSFQIIVWLWLTVIFANFAEAVAEGRGKAQAATLRRARTETMAKLLRSAGAGDYRNGRRTRPQGRRPGPGRGRRHHPERWRGDRGHRLGRRGGDHRRIARR